MTSYTVFTPKLTPEFRFSCSLGKVLPSGDSVSIWPFIFSQVSLEGICEHLPDFLGAIRY